MGAQNLRAYLPRNKFMKNKFGDQDYFRPFKDGVDDGRAFFSNEERSNLKALERKADEYVLEAIQALSLTIPPENFNLGNIKHLTLEVKDILFRRHGFHPFAGVKPGKTIIEKKESDAGRELDDTYTTERVEKILLPYINQLNQQNTK